MNGYNDNILKDGPWEEYWINGKLYWKENYVNGKRHGLYESYYYTNGKLGNLEFFL
jgi:antitoxin component YwqK of YwqJK toxin-antitoxin module